MSGKRDEFRTLLVDGDLVLVSGNGTRFAVRVGPDGEPTTEKLG